LNALKFPAVSKEEEVRLNGARILPLPEATPVENPPAMSAIDAWPDSHGWLVEDAELCMEGAL